MIYKYIVHVMPIAPGGWTFRPLGGGDRFEGYAHRSTEASHIENLTSGQEAVINTWYARDEENAKMLAKHLSAQRPGQMVCITEVKTVAQAGVPKVTLSVLSDRGLVPA